MRPTEKTPSEAPAEVPPEATASSRHTLTVGAQTLTYTATASTTHLKGKADQPQAAIFSVAYTVDCPDPSTRPVTFCFNGGPGSSSVWLHLGALGPKRVEVPDAVSPQPPPYSVVDNPEGLLDLTDLVFIDPVGTGLSAAVGEGKQADFTQVKGDVTSVGEFIERWISRNKRWNAPKFLAGESYGTTRAAGLAEHLHDRGIALNGLVLFSVAFDFQTFIATPGNDLPHVLMLPSYAATAAYHGKVTAPQLLDFLEDAREFALGPYASGLLQGAMLGQAEVASLAEQLAAFTGIPAEEWVRHDLRIDQATFSAKLLEADRKVVGRLDSRYLGRSPKVAAASTEVDPSYDGPMGAFTTALNSLVRDTIGWAGDTPYEIINLEVNEGWTVDRGWWSGFIDVSGRLRRAMLANPHLRVYVANGLYDLATPFAASEYSVAHLGTEPELQAAVSMHDYEAGHMMYLHEPSRLKMRADLAAFYAGVLKR